MRERGVELGEDEAGVAVDGLAEGEDGDAPVGDPEGGEVGARERGRLQALRVGDAAEGEVPYYLLGILVRRMRWELDWSGYAGDVEICTHPFCKG